MIDSSMAPEQNRFLLIILHTPKVERFFLQLLGHEEETNNFK
jgi:hypothetical protein